MARKLQSHAAAPLWSRLPHELRYMVFEYLSSDESINAGETSQRLSDYAAICKEWQKFFEKETFRHLRLHQDDLENFERIVHSDRRDLVNHLWLRLELRNYDCNQCNERESDAEDREHNLLLTSAIWKLFRIMSPWTSCTKREALLTLELSAHSPSDSEHHFKELEARIDDTAYSSGIRGRKLQPRDDPQHHWVSAGRILNIPESTKERVTGSIQGLRFDRRASCARVLQSLPEVHVVDVLMIRRQFYRAFSVKDCLIPVIKALPQVRQIKYEPWRGVSTAHREKRDEQYKALFEFIGRSNRCQYLFLFEDFSDILNYSVHTTASRNSELGKVLARSTRDLKSINVAFAVDAIDFFDEFSAGQKATQDLRWRNLRTIALTSKLLNERSFGMVIHAAGRAALRMPKLQFMELWHVERGKACVFRYVISGEGYATVRVVRIFGPGLRLSTSIHGDICRSGITLWMVEASIITATSFTTYAWHFNL
ncbi:uncharacterized protein BCR38DRAFT_455344 [Pseudomassariella vexata]|uniref:DUF6546 domain-containing protein n=1 Tax=Pseudomassariella vexata TaxID=1141098 RepID=A0A1Y2EAN6_9PEZI|nr:uncharacterized protein BCR38DRAFT_455344 [Pseudomassariella vexata]ORY68316.1 hypothetical protein BCR38DRAFT_455344 [Pseudomassariella vexata]